MTGIEPAPRLADLWTYPRKEKEAGVKLAGTGACGRAVWTGSSATEASICLRTVHLSKVMISSSVSN